MRDSIKLFTACGTLTTSAPVIFTHIDHALAASVLLAAFFSLAAALYLMVEENSTFK